MTERAHTTRLMAVLLALACAATGSSLLLAAPAEAAITRAFTPVFTTNTTGDVILRGNTLLTCPAGSTSGSTTCAAAQAGANIANNQYAMAYVDVDSDPTTFNSSSATITVPTGATVLYAALTWGATTSAGATVGTVPGAAAPTAAARDVVSLMAPGGSYVTVTSTKTDVSGSVYQGFKDVTAIVSAAGSGSYTVANVQSGTGGNLYAGWTLTIAYRDPTQPTRNLVIYSGFGTVTGADSSLPITVSGFTTPASGPVITRLGVVAYEGDRGSVGDGLKLGDSQLTNDLNPVNDVFNSTVTDVGVAVSDRNPSYVNLLGYDIDRLDATGVLANGATSTTITLNTASPSGETYYPGLITFATELYAPVLTVVKTVSDVNGRDVTQGDLLDYSVTVSNTAGEIASSAVLTDAIPSGTTYVAGSLKVDGVGRTDATADDVGDVTAGVIRVRLGTGATSSVGGSLAINASTIVAFRVAVNTNATDGTIVSNAASLAATNAATGATLATQSNTVSSTVLSLALTFATPLPEGLTGTAYTTSLTQVGGTAAYTWTVTAGALPAGLTLNSATGRLSGTPTAAGTASFTVTITDGTQRTASRAATLVIKTLSTLTLTSSSPSSTQFGSSSSFTATVGPAPATGTVTFTSAPQTGTPVTLGSGTVNGAVPVSLTRALPAFGANVVTASYDGDATHTAITSASLTVEVTGYAGEVIVTEFRGSGPSGANDSYVELLNTGPAAPMAGFRVQRDSGTTTTLPANAGTLGTGRSYLLTGTAYSLGAIATTDRPVGTLGTGGVRVLAPDTAGTPTDAVGPSAGYHTGTGLPAMTGAPTAQHAWVRDETAGRPRNTGNNAADFRLVSTTGAIIGGLQSTIGGASPTGTTSPYQHNGSLRSTLLDTGRGQALTPNRSDTAGQLIVRRTITNTSGATITAAKMRVTSLSAANGAPRPGGTQPATHANLRVITGTPATSVITLSTGGSITVNNLAVDAPATTLGGGLNSTLTLPLPGAGLAPGASISVAVTFAVDTAGPFWFGYDIDATETAALPVQTDGAMKRYGPEVAPAGKRAAFAPSTAIQGNF